MRCSFYKDTFDDTSTYYVSIESVLSGIKNGRWKEQIEHVRSIKEKSYRDKTKQYLPAACFSGCFESKMVTVKKTGKRALKSRYDGHIIEYTGIVIIDIDIKDESILSRVRSMMREDPYVYSFFESPSGGLKVLYIVDSSSNHHRDVAYNQIKEWVETNYDIKVDGSGKNLSRLCYVSYDPDIYINGDSIVSNIDTSKKDEEVIVNKFDYSNLSVETDVREVYKIAKGWLESNGDFYRKGNRNEYMHKMSCILNRAGFSKEQMKSLIRSNHALSKEMYNELDNITSGVSSRNRFEFGVKPIRSSNNNSNKQDFFS